ncbi:MAG: hypothetical protein JXM74_03775 [Fusobacteriaceae bacterium]|nr:hypothetical protein [Fusobacteriaceae bacterium]
MYKNNLENIFEKFKHEISLIKANMLFNELLRDDLFDKLGLEKISKIERRKNTYRSTIISMSSLFESTIDNFIEEYLIGLNNIYKKFTDIPEKVIKNHTKLSIEYLNKISSRKSVDRDRAKEENIIHNLYSCSINKEYKLNIEALMDRSANYRIGNLKSIFIDLGLEDFSVKIKKNKNIIEKISDYYKVEYSNFSDKFKDKKLESIFFELDRLSILRNGIAHNIFLRDILGKNRLNDIIFTLELLVEGTYTVLNQDLSEKMLNYKVKIKELCLIEKKCVERVLINKKTIEFSNLREGKFKKNDYMFVKKEDVIYKKKIVKIDEYDKILNKFTEHIEYQIIKESDVNIVVDNLENISDGCKFYITY